MTLKLVKTKQRISEEKPREKILNYGIETLNDVELWSVIFGMGLKNMKVKDLSSYLLSEFGNKGLLQFTNIQDVQEKTGLPLVKSCQILAIAEYFRRVSRTDNEQITSSEKLYQYIKNTFNSISFERLIIVCTDSQRRVLYSGIIAQGKVNTLNVSLAEVFHHPIRLNALNFYLAHNHPHGKALCSEDDINFTMQIKKEALRYGLSFDDHIILGENDFYSFALKGLL